MGVHKTSVAIPDFQASPIPFIMVEIILSDIPVNLMENRLLYPVILNTFAISSKLLSKLASSSCTVCQTSGITIKKQINIGRKLTFINRYAKIINDTTGTARITRIAGDNNMLKILIWLVKMPKTIPPIVPHTKPVNILISVNDTDFQKELSRKSRSNAENTAKGEGKNSLRLSFISMLATSKISIQNTTAIITDKTFLIVLFSIVIEIILGHSTAYRCWVGVKEYPEIPCY